MEIGDIVLYRVSPNDDDTLRYNHAEFLPAIVTVVWSDECVNLKIMPDSDGGPVWKTSVLRGDEVSMWKEKE